MDMSGVGYIELLRRNSSFRRLFVANEISFIGDWFTVIALFILAGEATDNSPLAIAGVMASRSFALALVTPFTGMLADRYSRKGLMLGANIASLVILVFVLALDLLGNLTSVYVLAVVMVAARAVFDPAEYAYLPNICDDQELLTANALASGGGAQVFLLILIGMEAGFGEVATGIGILFMARGFGSGFGPIAGRPLMENPRLRPYLLGLAVGVCGLFYIAVSVVEWTEIVLILVFFSHAASGLNWVLSTTFLQERSADEWRGRVAGTDHFGITLMMGISAVIGGLIMENNILGLRELIALTGMVQIALGLAWIVLASSHEKRLLDQTL